MHATTLDEDSVVGDECHIAARGPGGPRRDESIADKELDAYPNLILLCKIHHKLIDDQPNTYTADVLRTLKRRHEQWVRETLHHASGSRARMHVAGRIATGKEALSIVLGADAFDFDYDEAENEEELELISELLQCLHDWGDLGLVAESGDRVKAGFRLTQDIKQLDDLGFHVFGVSENREYNVSDKPMDITVAVIRIIRKSNPGIIDLSTCGSRAESQEE
jgi:hypothetical protein